MLQWLQGSTDELLVEALAWYWRLPSVADNDDLGRLYNGSLSASTSPSTFPTHLPIDTRMYNAALAAGMTLTE